MENSNDHDVLTEDVDQTKAEEQNEPDSTGTQNSDPDKNSYQINLDPLTPPASNSAKINADQSVNIQGSQVFHSLQFFFGEHKSKGPEHHTGPDPIYEKRVPDAEPDDDRKSGTRGPKKKQPTTADVWLELTSEFVTPRGIGPQFDQTELLNQCNDLETNKLIFITCADEQMAKVAAASLVEQLDDHDVSQKRLLDFGRLSKESSNPEITQLLQGGPRKSKIAVVVDLFNPKAEDFFLSLIDNVVHSPDPLRMDLQRAQVYLICVVYAAELRSKLNLLNAPTAFTHDRLFPHWEISFLEPLLQYHFPDKYQELAAKILDRRHWWDLDERVFCHQIKTLIHERRLVDTLNTPPRVEDLPGPQTLFKNQDPLVDTVLYAGTFFMDLKPREFNRVVNLLLGKKTKTITVSTVRKNENGTTESIEVEREKPLTELWQEATDKIKADCGLTAVSGLDGATIVGFRNHKLREELRDYLRSHYPFFLDSQLEQLMDGGLLFDSSDNIANNVIDLAADVAVTDAEYLQEWVEKLLDEMDDFFALDLELSRTISPALQPLATLKLRDAKALICKRLAALLRRMLEMQGLKETVNELLERFMRRHTFLYVLEIVKALRFASEFDEYYWFKQLIERGDKECRDQTLLSLSQRMQNSGPRVYQMLQGMDSWVKLDPDFVSRSGVNALELLIDFCVHTTVFLSFDQYGAWPSSHPLFRFADADTARSSLRLLSRWLCHTWMAEVIVEKFETPSANYSIGALIAEWIFILLKPSETSSAIREVEPVNVGVTAFEVSEILIQQMAEAANQSQQHELLLSWQSGSEGLLKQIEQLSHVDAEGSVKIWKRNLLNDLIGQFKVAVYERQAAQMAS